jgi:hypothetical protein
MVTSKLIMLVPRMFRLCTTSMRPSMASCHTLLCVSVVSRTLGHEACPQSSKALVYGLIRRAVQLTLGAACGHRD